MRLIDRAFGAVMPRAALRRASTHAERGQAQKGLHLLIQAARAGIPDAEYRLGKHYLEGQIVPVSRSEALRWLEKSANQEYVPAQALLASLYLQGLAGGADGTSLFEPNGVNEPDYAAAERWARRAADHGSADGQALLGYIMTNGPDGLRDEQAAHDWYRRASEGGSPQGALGYALSLSRQLGQTEAGLSQPAGAEVVAQLRKAADAGLPTAYYLLAVLTDRGVAVPRDRAAAAQFYREAAERGNLLGQARWGLALLQGQGVEPDPASGESWLRRAALGGDAEAAALVGDLYAKGGGDLPPNFAEAALWFRRAAEAGHRSAARALGLLYLTGAGVGRDPEEAANWFRISAEAGDRQAQADLANLLLRGEPGRAVPAEDLVRTRQWFEEAALGGDLVAAFNFGVCLAEGVGIERDEKQAAEWLRRAAEGVVNAQYLYGRMLGEGRGVTPDLAEARAWIARAADSGMLDAQVALAEMMVNGRGGDKDHEAALALFQRAAGKGHVGAMFAIGALYGGGHDIPQNRAEAQRWFRAAAERGHGHAQMMLGRYLARGLSGTPDPVEARVWLERAVAQGVADARPDLAALSAEPAARMEQRALTH